MFSCRNNNIVYLNYFAFVFTVRQVEEVEADMG